MRSPVRLVVIVIVTLLPLAACSSDTKVGDKSLLNVKGQVNGRLGGTTTTQATTPQSGGVALGVGQTTTTKPAAVATTAPPEQQEQATIITINSDNSPQPQFDPPGVSVYAGTLVRFTNNDKVVRSVVGANNAFRSPDIAPGASWQFRPSTPGTYDYQDGTRPYAVGQLQVASR